MNTTNSNHIVQEAEPDQFSIIGKLMVEVYSNLEGFPSKIEQPEYYQLLANIGSLTENTKTRLLVAISPDGKIDGAVVYFGDMKYYGSGGIATLEKDAAGFRLLAVDPAARGLGLGKLLTDACIQLAKDENQIQMIIHTTKAMQIAWKMYESLGFRRSEDLDFMQESLPVFGFRLSL